MNSLNIKLVCLNIANMYSNVLIKELLEINRFLYSQNDIVEEVNKEIINYSKIITQQNYFQ